jgi:hypothetical protein
LPLPRSRRVARAGLNHLLRMLAQDDPARPHRGSAGLAVR